MPKLQTIQEVEQALLPLAATTKWTTGKNIAAARTKRLLDYVGNPQQCMRLVHVAGTSGKTSTTSYLAAQLHAGGATVGHTTSPHIDSVTERVQINGRPLSDAAFCQYSSRFLGLIQAFTPAPSWQEYFTAFALWVFGQEQVDYAVLETAVGGLYDATNAVTSANKVCVITDIGYDHMELLGSTLESITVNKAGIIHPGNTAIMYPQGPVVTNGVQEYASRHSAQVILATQSKINGILPHFQQRNWELALAAYQFIAERDKLPQLPPDAIRATQAIVIPGRMEQVQIKGTTIIMDGAHNPQKMAALVDSFGGAYPNMQVPVVLALKDSKDIAGTIAPLVRIASTVLITTFPPVAGISTTAADPQAIAAELQAQGVVSYQIIPDPLECFYAAVAIAHSNNSVLITGSFYLLAAIRKHLAASNNKP